MRMHLCILQVRYKYRLNAEQRAKQSVHLDALLHMARID
jgi:hypothetical protein